MTLLDLIPGKVYLYAGLGVALGIAAIWYHHEVYKAGYEAAEQIWKEKYDQYVAAEAANDKAQWNDHIAKDQKAVSDYELQIASLKADLNKPAPVVRVCIASPGVRPNAVTADPGRDKQTGPASGPGAVVPERTSVGPDIGDGLRNIAALSQRLAIELAACRASK
jgi:hypothetical protein